MCREEEEVEERGKISWFDVEAKEGDYAGVVWESGLGNN